MRAQSHRDTCGNDLDDAAERVPGLLGGVDLHDHGGAGSGIGAAHGVGVETLSVLSSRRRHVIWQGDSPDAYDVADQPDTGNLGQDGLGECPQRHTGGGLASRGPLQDRAGLIQVVLEHPRQVRMPGTGAGQGTITGDLTLVAGARVNEQLMRVHGVGAHHGGPLGPLGVADLQRDGATDGTAMTDTAQDPQLIALEGLASTTTVPQTPPGQRSPDVLTG